MRSEEMNKNKNCVFNGPYAGRDLYNIMYQDSEREFVVTHNANIKTVSYFTGRETELQELRQRIEDGRKSVLVSGMGGIGKTHICRKLFEEYYVEHDKGRKGPFQHIGYIQYNGDMNNSLQTCLKYKEQVDSKLNQEAAWKELKQLASDGKLLLIVDNVNVPISKDKGLQHLTTIPGAIIITSRLTSFSDEFETYKIGFLDVEQCKEIYEKIRFENSGNKIEPEEIQDLEYIIEKLAARHTITIEHLAHLAYVKRWTVRELKEKLEEKGFKIGYHKNGELINIQESYEVLYDLSELSKSEQNILEAFSAFPYIPLKDKICNQWLLSDAGVNEEADILTGLYRKGWLQFDMEQESYALHPVFAKFIYEKCKPSIEKHIGLIERCQECLKISESGYVLECQRYIPFAESIIDKLDIENSKEKEMFLKSLAYLLQYIGEYEEARKFYKLLLKKHEEKLDKSHIDIAIDYQNLAYLDLMQGNDKKAETQLKKSESLLKLENGVKNECLIVASIYTNLAFIYQKRGKYSEAENMYMESIKIQRNFLGEKNSDIVQNYNNLANLYECEEKYTKAENLYKLSLQINREVSQTNNVNTAVIYNNLAKLYEKQGKRKDAFGYFYEAYKILLLKLGPNHPRTQLSYKNMRVVYKKFNAKVTFEQWLAEKMKE